MAFQQPHMLDGYNKQTNTLLYACLVQLSETERAAVLALLVSLVPRRAATSTQPASPSWRSPAQVRGTPGSTVL